jgi:hypothetical protein
MSSISSQPLSDDQVWGSDEASEQLVCPLIDDETGKCPVGCNKCVIFNEQTTD